MSYRANLNRIASRVSSAGIALVSLAVGAFAPHAAAVDADLRVSKIICDRNQLGGRLANAIVRNDGDAMSNPTLLLYGVVHLGAPLLGEPTFVVFLISEVPALAPGSTFRPLVAVDSGPLRGCCFGLIVPTKGDNPTNNYRQVSVTTPDGGDFVAPADFPTVIFNPTTSALTVTLAIDQGTVPAGYQIQLDGRDGPLVAEVPGGIDFSAYPPGRQHCVELATGQNHAVFHFNLVAAPDVAVGTDMAVAGGVADGLGVWEYEWTNAQQGGDGQGPCDADLNHDGVVNGADLGLLIGSWGLDCPSPPTCP